MAENFEEGGNFQIVFLIDAFVKKQNICKQDLEDIYNVKSRAISLCVLRLLLHFNSVVERGNFAPLKWGFKFYNSNVLNFEYKRRRFYELNSVSFEQFEAEMEQRFTNACNSQSSASTAGAKSLSCCLTEILHDFPWATPDISSPSRSAKNDQFSSQGGRRRNYLFVIGDCPLSDEDMCSFLGGAESSFDADVVFKEIFSTALYEEFHSKCGLSLFWIDSGLWCVAPEKLKTAVEDWKGYSLISCVTKQLSGNMISISSLVQDARNICLPCLENSTLNPKEFKSKAKTLAEVQVMGAAFKFSFGKIVEAFLSGRDWISEDVINDVKLIPNRNGLLKGILCFQEKKLCPVVLSHMLQKKTTSTIGKYISNIKKLDDANNHNHDNINVEKPTSNDNASLPASQQILPDSDLKANIDVNSSTSTNSNAEPKTEKVKLENCFVIKGVIASADVSPSWMHPTKLYSCFSGEILSSGVVEDLGLFQQMLSLICSKSLSMVIEYQDPDTGTNVIGLLQPITSLCAVLSMVKKDKLLLVEKALLRHKSRGYTLVLSDVTSDEGDFKSLPFDLRENKEDVGRDEGECSILSRLKDERRSEKGITRSYICSFQKKKLKEHESEKELFVKLKDYYSKKKSKSNSEKGQVLMRGRLMQETSQKNSTKLNERELQNKNSSMETETSTATLSNFDSEQTDTMDEDLPDMTVIQSVEDLKTSLKDDYERCLNQEQSMTVYVTRAFQMITHFKHSGQLKDIDEIYSLLKATVLCDSKKSRENFDAEKHEPDKERVVLEYKLQVFLRLEFAHKIGVVDEEKMADEITFFLRAISFQKDPAYLSSFLKNSVIQRYASNLSSLLCQVYDGLMQRPPKEILSPSQVTSEEDTPLKSRRTFSSSKKAKSVEEAHSESSQSSRTLVRRHSVMGVPSKRREIVIPVKGKSGKPRKKVDSVGKTSGKKQKIKMPVTPVKKVRRNLFEGNGSKSSPRKHSSATSSKSERSNLTRRHSIAAFNKSKKVADTPAGKQVSQRMLRRQEWARRRSKTVTDVTVVVESPDKDVILPRKSPRRKAATFYSASQRAPATAKTTNRNLTTSAECTAEDKINSMSDNNSSRTLQRDECMDIDSGLETVSSPRKKYTKLLSADVSSSPKLNKDDSFSEVFLETGDKNERTILSACILDRQGDTTSGQNIVPGSTCDDPNLPLSASKKNSKNNMSTECPSDSSTKDNKATECLSSVIPNKSTTSPLTAVQSRRSVSQRSNSSPSLSNTTPVKSLKSPLTTHKSFPITSPVLFESPKRTPKSSPISFSPDQIFDIAIPLVPVESPYRRPTKTEVAKNSRLKSSPLTSLSGFVGTSSEVAVGDVETESESVGLKSENVVDDVESDGNDSESVVAVSPLLSGRRASKLGGKFLRSKTSLNFGSCTGSMGFDPTTDVEGDFLTVGNAEVQRPEFDTREQSEVFKSPVTTKRKRIGATRTGNVSPMNQILKQRKNNRNTPPGTSRLESCKLERTENSYKGETPITIRRKRKIIADEEESEREQLDGSSLYISDDNLSPGKNNSNLSTGQQRKTKLNSSPCNLKPHFTAMSLSADSLKHLQESPVLLGSSPQSSELRTRKWSERKSPLSTSQHSLRKRLRHDS